MRTLEQQDDVGFRPTHPNSQPPSPAPQHHDIIDDDDDGDSVTLTPPPSLPGSPHRPPPPDPPLPHLRNPDNPATRRPMKTNLKTWTNHFFIGSPLLRGYSTVKTWNQARIMKPLPWLIINKKQSCQDPHRWRCNKSWSCCLQL